MMKILLLVRSRQIKEYEIEDSKLNRYVADFEYADAQYQLMGAMEKDEFEKIIKNLFFYRINA